MDMQARLVGIYVEKDIHSVFTFCNNVLLQYAGVKSDSKILGITDFELPWQEYAPIYRNHELDVLAGDNYSSIIPLKDHNGDDLLFLHTKVQKIDEQGNVCGISCRATEILNPHYFALFKLLNKINTAKKPVYHLGKKSQLRQLTSREEECLFYLLRGKTAKETARILTLSTRTIESHIENLKNKFSVHTKSELIEAAMHSDFANKIPTQLSIQDMLDALR